ncbi:transporter substrate-binding domain-containing protein [Mycobacterium sp. KBS0706]|uniref:transporter substrate-binding domain-containing protein n=1 Tax=Mycobacterium sp. KBS0706 TaxID=2578109 RepID=UPI00110FECB9|nr:transporter substrate-binding domain-containing protein [Mycobacterium sp. KBS0706]TSD84074.1 transporter substrate-binding domain-containing protein [Mycobacterium sp. KBS0706]
MRLLATAALLLALPAAAAIAADRTDTLDAVAKAGVLKVCTTGDYKPFTYLDPAKGEYEGIDIDMARDLAAALGVKAEFVKTSWKTLMADFTSGACDMAMGGISVTLQRQKQAFFSVPIDVDGKTPITKCENVDKFQTVEQIDQPGVRVIEPPGGTNEAFVRERIKSAEITIFPDNTKIFDEILAGRADVMITDASETRLQQKLRPGLCAVHPDQPFTFAEKAYLLPRGDVVFKAFVDQWLNLRLNDGSHAKFSAVWMG